MPTCGQLLKTSCALPDTSAARMARWTRLLDRLTLLSLFSAAGPAEHGPTDAAYASSRPDHEDAHVAAACEQLALEDIALVCDRVYCSIGLQIGSDYDF